MSLSEIRKEIDETDDRIRELFIHRMELSKKVAMEKAKTGDAIYKPDREREIIERLTLKTDPQIRDAYESLLRHIMKLSREYQYSLISALQQNAPSAETGITSQPHFTSSPECTYDNASPMEAFSNS